MAHDLVSWSGAFTLGPSVVNDWAIGSRYTSTQNYRITHLGAWVNPDVTWTQTYSVRVYRVSDQVLLAQLDMLPGDTVDTVGQFKYKQLGSPVNIPANTPIQLQVNSGPGGNFWSSSGGNGGPYGNSDFAGGVLSFASSTSHFGGASPTDFAMETGGGTERTYVGPSMRYLLESEIVQSPTTTTISGATSGTVGTPSAPFTFGLDQPAAEVTTITPVMGNLAGSWNPTTVTVQVGQTVASLTSTFTASAVGTGTPTTTNNKSLANATASNFVATSTAATALTLTGPTSGTVGVASGVFTVTANGTLSGSVVVTNAMADSTTAPSTLTLNSSTLSGTFTGTPSSTGVKAVSITNNGGLTNPSAINYTAAAAAAPTIGALSVSSNNTTAGIVVAFTTGSGSGNHTPQLHRSTSMQFTPGSGTLVATGTAAAAGARTLTDPSPLIGVANFYRVVVTDTTSGTVTSKQNTYENSLQVNWREPRVMGFIGDSITQFAFASNASLLWHAIMVNRLNQTDPFHYYTAINKGLSGSTSGDWAGSVGGGTFLNAMNDFTSAGVSDVFIMLGTNDAKTAVSTPANTYANNITTIINACRNRGWRVFYSGPPGMNPTVSGEWDGASVDRTIAYRNAIAGFDNGTTIKLTAKRLIEEMQPFFASDMSDIVHPNDTGHARLGEFQANGYLTALERTSGASTAVFPTAGQVLEGIVFGPTSNLTGTLKASTGGGFAVRVGPFPRYN